MDFEEIRRQTIIALFSDDVLFDQIVLKGGNALGLIHGITTRTSLDLDFSIRGDFDDLDKIRDRIHHALTQRFDLAGFVVFDLALIARPGTPHEISWWGGYLLTFKLISKKEYETLNGNLRSLQRQAYVVSPGQKRVFEVEFSKHEYCKGAQSSTLNSFEIFLYTPAMIAVEKLRAICQQMEEYPLSGRTKSARSRDFYDITKIVQDREVGFSFQSAEGVNLIQEMFSVKEVPLHLIGLIHKYREHHRKDWIKVESTISDEIESFDYYFDFVLNETEALKSLWDMQSPTIV